MSAAEFRASSFDLRRRPGSARGTAPAQPGPRRQHRCFPPPSPHPHSTHPAHLPCPAPPHPAPAVPPSRRHGAAARPRGRAAPRPAGPSSRGRSPSWHPPNPPGGRRAAERPGRRGAPGPTAAGAARPRGYITVHALRLTARRPRHAASTAQHRSQISAEPIRASQARSVAGVSARRRVGSARGHGMAGEPRPRHCYCDGAPRGRSGRGIVGVALRSPFPKFGVALRSPFRGRASLSLPRGAAASARPVPSGRSRQRPSSALRGRAVPGRPGLDGPGHGPSAGGDGPAGRGARPASIRRPERPGHGRAGMRMRMRMRPTVRVTVRVTDPRVDPADRPRRPGARPGRPLPPPPSAGA